MRNSIVRLQEIELINFKNVKKGNIVFRKNIKNEIFEEKSDILGIYGQNGSGKTAVIEAIYFLKTMLTGESLPKDAYNYINKFSKNSILKFVFYIQRFDKKILVEYIFELQKTEDKKVIIVNEKLKYSKYIDDEWGYKTSLIEYNIFNNDILFEPKIRYEEIINRSKNNEVNLKVAKTLAIEKGTSFIFSEYLSKIFKDSIQNIDNINISDSIDFTSILSILGIFGKINLYVIKNEHSGVISANTLLPFSFRIEENENISCGDIAVNLEGQSIINENLYKMLEQILKQMNKVLVKIIPTLNISVKEYGKQIDEKGNEGIVIELLSCKDDLKIPLKFESEGIKKIISILSILIAVYNNPSICVAIDELDSGIYEFLLGEILEVLDVGGKGQLIFTSHNLRALEILKKENLYFTTVNPENRYIHLNYIKTNNNLRDVYIRCINLGGQKEDIYNETDSLEIGRAFRLAGEAIDK